MARVVSDTILEFSIILFAHFLNKLPMPGRHGETNKRGAKRIPY